MRFKKVVALGLTLVMSSTVLFGCGCSVDSDTPIIGTLFGLKDNQVFKVDKLICTKPEYMLQILDTANKYKAGFGGTVDWNAKVTKEESLSQYTLDQVKEAMSVKYTIASMAKDKQVTLSSGEEEAIKSAAKKYYAGLTDAEKKFTGAKESDVVKVYKNYKLADKVFGKVTEEQDVSVSDEETRAAKINYIRMSSDKHPQDYIDKWMKYARMNIKNNYQPFSREARQFSDDDTFVKVIYKNEAKKDYEKKVFNMESGELSQIIKDGKDYYIIQCVDNYLKKESADNKQKLIDKNKKEYFNKEYKEYLDEVDTDFNSSSVSDVKLPTSNEYVHYDLITIFDKDVK
ncbi:MAG: peptidyl-prolyl cis-trans isomerase [Eubacterium sp.]|nr:peptidyl-prolyl cis-trans isomerase [Eubacterium sp.]